MSTMVRNGSLPRPSLGLDLAFASDSDPTPSGGEAPRQEPLDFPRRVLLVDPSPIECHRIRNQLIADQLEVATAGDLIMGLAAVATYRPDLVLCQLRMPTFGGLDLVRRLKE